MAHGGFCLDDRQGRKRHPKCLILETFSEFNYVFITHFTPFFTFLELCVNVCVCVFTYSEQKTCMSHFIEKYEVFVIFAMI